MQGRDALKIQWSEGSLPNLNDEAVAAELLAKLDDGPAAVAEDAGNAAEALSAAATVVESVYAAKMCRAINNANVLCLGQMIWGPDMAKAAVDVFLTTKFTEGLEGISDFLHNACKTVEAIRP